MSKNVDEKPVKLKGKQKKIAESKTKNTKTVESNIKESNVLNHGCCCTCVHFPRKVNHETQPCKIKGSYVARKATFDCYKCKYV